MLTEKLITTLYDMVGDTMGRHNLYWAPYIGTLFLSSALGSLIGMTGFLRSATSDLSTTLTWALMTSVLVWVCSIRANGVWGWLKGLCRACGGHAAHEYRQRDRAAHLHGIPSFRQYHGRRRADKPLTSLRWPQPRP